MPAEPKIAQLRRQTKKETDELPFKVSGHAREIEQKRARGEISCAECRRLKIKCSKEIPCSSCIRRGCRSICPQGSLATGEGTRYVLAATEHLHRRISHLSSRIRELEDALANEHQRHSDEPHPLLREDNLFQSLDIDLKQREVPVPMDGIDKSPEVIQAFGTLRISEHGVSRFFGSSAGSELLLMSVIDQNEEEAPSNSPSPPSAFGDHQTQIAQSVAYFSRSFPLTPLGSVQEVRSLIETYLPPWDRAQHLCRLYFAEVSWLIKSVLPSQVYDDMVPYIYRKRDPLPGEEHSSPHELALLFIVFALGALVESSAEARDGYPDLQEAEHYHQISKAALPLQPLLEKPSICACQTLHLMSIYYAMSGEDLTSQTSMEMTWNLVNLAAHLAQTIGLHRDSARWGLDEKMVQRRRTIFWDLYTADVWNSLTTGRPPSFSLAYIDCKLPDHSLQGNKDSGALPYENWHTNFSADVVSDVAAKACAAQTPTYDTIMELDKKVRDYPLPTFVKEESMVAAFQKCICDHIRETILLYIHRSFFAQALLDEPSNPLKSKYAPSFLATYRSSAQILRVVRDHYALFPNAASRWWMMWSYAFSAAVVFGIVVTRGPRSPLANSAMKELDEACVLFSKVAVSSRRASKLLPILGRLNSSARAALAAAKDDPTSGAMWTLNNDDHDDLPIFAGHTRLVYNQQPVSDPTMRGGHSSTSVSLTLPPTVPNTFDHQPSLPQQAPVTVPSSTSPLNFFSPQQETMYRSSNSASSHPVEHTTQTSIDPYTSWSVPSQNALAGSSSRQDISPLASGRQGNNDSPFSAPEVQAFSWPQPAAAGMSRAPPQDHRRSPDKMNYHLDIQSHPNPQRPEQPPTMFPGPFPRVRAFDADRGTTATVDLGDMGIATTNSRLDEQFISFMNDSGILGDDGRRQHRLGYGPMR